MGCTAEVGVFGGTGFYNFLEDVSEAWIETPYGPTSDKVALATVGGKRVAFMPRHGKGHTIPPHTINYRANLWAMKELGVTRVISPCAAGSLQPDVKPGDLVVCDQFVDRTYGRKDTFYDGPVTTHISAAEPYCPELRRIAIAEAKNLHLPVHETGTVVVIQGPRFSTKSESRWFSRQGWEVINMTQYPECVLARELNLCYVNISVITDYDAGLEGHPDVAPVTHEEVIKAFQANIGRLKDLLFQVIAAIPAERGCSCADALKLGRA